MLEDYFSCSRTVQRHRGGLLGPHVDGFVVKLAAQGYSRFTIRIQCAAIRDLDGWLRRKGIALEDVDGERVGRYLRDRRRRGRFASQGEKTIRSFVEHLREGGLIQRTLPPAASSPLEKLLQQYAAYLLAERGLVQATVDNYLPFVHHFLSERFADGPLSLKRLVAADVSGFVLRWVRSHSSGRAKLMTTALRSFLRFALARGRINVDLVASVPTVANWNKSTLPRHLSREQVECVLDACSRADCVGKRNYALLLLLARLGLRAGEVVAMELGDIDWRAGEITVRGKGSCRDRMPLPADVGEALADYLRYGRPACSTRRVFLRARAPHRGFRGSSTVDCIVRSMLTKAGLNPPVRGAHLLRHSLATVMLRSGASMAEIGQILRHRSPATTEIYAKVDVDGLRPLAQPWPEAAGAR